MAGNEVITPETMDAAVKAAVEAKEEEIVKLTRDNLNLLEQVQGLQNQIKSYASPTQLKALQDEILSLKEVTLVYQIRSLVQRGLIEGRFLPAWTRGYEGKDALDSAGTIRWLRASRFYDSASPNPDQKAFEMLKFAATNFPQMYKLNQQHPSGTPLPDGKIAVMSVEEKAALKARGYDPSRLACLSNEMTYEEWNAAVGPVTKETK